MESTQQRSPSVPSEHWTAFCRRAHEYKNNYPSPLDDLRVWQNFDYDTQVSFHNSLEAYENAEADLNFRIALIKNLCGYDRIAPDPSQYDVFTQYVGLQEDLQRARAHLPTATQAVESSIQAAASDGFLTATLRDTLVNWMTHTKAAQQNELDGETVNLPRLKAQLAVIRNKRMTGDPGKDWVKGGVLGKGTYGESVVFLRQNADGVVTDRIAIKTSDIDPNDERLWNSSGTAPTEATAMVQLQKCSNSECIVQIRNWAVAHNRFRHKIYMEFCPYGDLAALSDHYKPVMGLRLDGFVPEPFAWCVLENLVKAGLLMRQGDLDQPIQGWEGIVHRDMKPPNLFMADNPTDVYRNYPIPKLGDFGLAVFPKPPATKYAWNQPIGYMAPEQCNSRLLQPGQVLPPLTGLPLGSPETGLSSKSDVWAVGYVMWSLLTGKGVDPSYRQAMSPNGQFQRERTLQYSIDQTAYSPTLRNAIYRCLRYQPAERPNFLQLLHYINLHTGSHVANDLSQGLRHAEANPTNAGRFPVPLGVDNYGLGGKMANAAWLPPNTTAPPAPGRGTRLPGDPPTPDNIMFGQPGRTFGQAPVQKASLKRASADDSSEGRTSKRLAGREPRMPAVGSDTSRRSSLAKGGASPSGR
ncbi:uncharacterized protein RCC_03645 [Ramularia collo-cygni]|uniref:non-specific serine/threonine protein kinase n=1 Tax=Ramularia collo-cygni TaxID=112498 RepID=A0A2D3V8I7_9PEZI|nr:uncharacterized protein RCC_03645 [Ramularia collo-cygni]CZT17809.1 uncharacterized protein RCC_03645 [Ramularia collo-cygni]